MMIAGFIVTTGVAGHLLDPFSPRGSSWFRRRYRSAAIVLTLLGVWGVEAASRPRCPSVAGRRRAGVRSAKRLPEVWTEPKARRFAIFVFVSMLAYSAQDLILEPFAGAVFGFTPGETTKLSGIQHGGTLIGMALVPLIGAIYPRARGILQIWTIGGCLASAIALLCLAAAAVVGPAWPLRETVFMLGVTNGAYAVAAIGSMMALVGAGGEKARGRAHGPVGRGAGRCVRDRRLSRDARQRHRARSADVAGTVLSRRLRIEAGLFVVAAVHGGLGSSRAGKRRDATAAPGDLP